ncbi:Zeaxanthin epoxidase [Durusdinium trenchii]|uniref:Chloroplastic n=3 Tax=Durusdinium trenchii TaxID=1381693 RepID=A0ABP0M1G5_9DINO
MLTGWTCACGFRNREVNSACGGSGPLGCKASRPGSRPGLLGDTDTDGDPMRLNEVPARCAKTLRILTYNVWFSPIDREIRMAALAAILESVDADVIALQEVTSTILELLMGHLSSEWQVFKQEPAHVEDLYFFEANYFTCLLVKRTLQVEEAACFRFSITAMARGLQLVVFSMKIEDEGMQTPERSYHKIIVATSHLESAVASRSGQDTRAHQLSEGLHEMTRMMVEKDCDAAIWLGDMNWISDETERDDMHLPDGWKESGPSDLCRPVTTAREAQLPLWYPDDQPLQSSSPFGVATGELPLSHLVPPAPTATCTGHDKVSISWQLQGTRLLDFTWQVRVRAAPDAEWQKVDLDSGRIEAPEVTTSSWKHRACLVQKGLKVLSFCVEEGRKSQRPIPGTVVSHYPGLVTVDFELIGGQILRQRVPQDWVLLAATSREIKDVAWSLLETRFGGRGGRRLWRVAKNKVYERIIRTHRQCAVLWKQRVELPEPGCRVSINCAMGLQVMDHDEKEDFSPDGSRTTRTSASREGRAAARSISSWWPAVLPVEAEYDLRQGTDVPEELCTRADLKVHLEPYPRVQVIPRHWICEELPESERAKRNICIGQSVLAYYAVSAVGSEDGGEVWGAHPEPREAGDVTLQFGGAHMTERPDSEDRFAQARKTFFGAREVQHRSERAVRSKVLRELISPAEVYVYLQCMDRRKPVRVPLASIWSVQPNEPTRRTVRKRRKVLEWMVIRSARDRAAEVVARQGSSAGLYHPAYGYLWDEAIPLTPGVKVSFFSLPGRGDATTASVASLASPGGFAFRRLSTGTIVRTVAKVSHYEVLFDEVVPENRWISAFNVGHHLQPDGSVQRLRRPELTIHDLPDEMHKIEVSVGLSAAFGGENVHWSEPSQPCRVLKAGVQPLPPLPPMLTVLSISRAQVRWMLPKEPAPLCFRLRMRERGSKEWCCLDSFGHARDEDTTLAWRSRLVPLVEGVWVSAFGDFDQRKSSTPGAARVHSVDWVTGSVEVEFVRPQDDFCIGGVPTSVLACTQCSQKLGLVQDELHTIPFAWIEAVWVADGTNYLKGTPMANHTEEKQALATVNHVDGHPDAMILQVEDEQVKVVDELWLKWLAKKGNMSVQLTAHEVVGLKAEVGYEFSVQALTKGGWTEWSTPGSIQMPRIGYEQEQLVSERRANALYRADLLPQALYKEYERCWDSVDESLTADRLDRIHQVLHGKKELAEEFDHELSRWLVDMEGPIRESSRMLEAEARLLLRDLVSRKANVNYRDQATGRVPLTYACEYGWKVKTGVIEELLLLRADVDSMNDARHTALGIAAAGGHANIVEVLLAHGADATIVSLQGETALLRAKTVRGMTHGQIKGVNRCRDLLRDSRLLWESFESAVANLADDPVAAARAFLEIAFPKGPQNMFVADKEGRRISRHDKLRLYEQILEVREVEDGLEEGERRGRMCAHKLLLPQVSAATLQQPPNTECNYFARYLLHSGIMRWCMREAKELASSLLAHYDKELQKRRSALRRLPRLTDEAEILLGSRPKFAGGQHQQKLRALRHSVPKQRLTHMIIGFCLPQAVRSAAAASMVASMLASSPALAEEDGLKSLESKLNERDQGIERLTEEKLRPRMRLSEVEKLEREEIQTARSAERLKEKQIAAEEQKAKERAKEMERKEKAQIEKEEKQAKDKIQSELEATKANIQKKEKQAVEEARRVERDEKKAAREMEKQALQAKTDKDRLAAEEASETAFNAATEKAEKAILEAQSISEEELTKALEKAEDARTAAAEKAELLEKAAVEKFETALSQAAETAERAEKDAVFEEEAVEQAVVETVDAIEKEDLLEENQLLEKAKVALSAGWTFAAPLVIPGIFIALYAVLASFSAPPPEPCLGAESEETRKMMGRQERPKTSKANMDPWNDEKKRMAAVGSGAMAVAAVLMSSGPVSGFVSPSSAKLTSRSVQRMAEGAKAQTTPEQSSKPSTFGRATLAQGAVAAVAVAAVRRRSVGCLAKKASKVIRLATKAKSSKITGADPLHVIISGAGVGGLLLAKALSKEPTIKVTLLEQASSFQRFGGPIQLASNALSTIRDIDEGLFEELMKRFTFTGYRRNGLVDALRSEWYCTFDAMKDAADLFDLPYTGVVDRPDLQEIMLKAIPAGCLSNSQKVSRYEVLPNNEGVKVFTQDGKEYQGDVLIGADGIWSATRAQMWNEDQKGPNSGCTYSGYIVFAGETIYKPEDYFDVGYKVYMGPKRYFVTSDVGRGRIQWYAFVAVAEGEEVPSDPLEKREYVKAAFQGWSPQIADLLDATPANTVEDRSLYDRPPSLFKSWAKGPVALLGDACHAMMPNLGQGGGQAMEDAHCILQKLKDLTDRSQVPDALQDYYRSRILRASAVQGLSRLASDILLGTFTFPWKPEEGLSAPYGKGRGDVSYESVVVNYLKYILPATFTGQFTFLYSFHPFKWTKDEVQKLVEEVMDRHKIEAHDAWQRRQQAVEKGEVEKFEEECRQESFFALVAQVAGGIDQK